MSEERKISKQALQRMPYYLQFLKKMKEEGKNGVSAPIIAAKFGFTEIQVRKDLACVSSIQGKPKVGFEISQLITDIETTLGYKHKDKAVIVGAGSLGHALLGYRGFSGFGIEIIAAFDISPELTGTNAGGKPILPISEMKQFCSENEIVIGVITVPEASAQSACDSLVEAGIKAIWNFAPTHLSVPSGILVQNENMAASLALLFKHVKENGK